MSLSGGLVGFTGSLTIIGIALIFVIPFWLIIRFWKKPKRNIYVAENKEDGLYIFSLNENKFIK